MKQKLHNKVIQLAHCYDCLKLMKESKLLLLPDSKGDRWVCDKCNEIDEKMKALRARTDDTKTIKQLENEDYRF